MKKKYNLEFSERLREVMIKKGHASRTAACGVSPAALSKAICCFTEMALRYLDGRSVPTPENVLKIAEWLEVDPSYLLFGEKNSNKSQDKNKITIDKELLNHALAKISVVIKKTENTDELIHFFTSILDDLSKMEIEGEQLKQVFDLALKSSIFIKINSASRKIDHERLRSNTSAS